MKPETLDSIGANGTKLTIVGAGTSGVGMLSASELAAIVGALVAVAGLVVSWYFKREAMQLRRLDDARKDREHQMRMSLMERTGVPIQHPECDTDLGGLE